MLRPKKIHTRNLITKKNSCASKIPHPPYNFSIMVRPLGGSLFAIVSYRLYHLSKVCIQSYSYHFLVLCEA